MVDELDNDFLDEETDSLSDDLDFGNDFNDFGMGDSISPMEKHSDLLKSLTEFDSYLQTLVSEWLGMVWDATTTKYQPNKDVKPIMNIQGARWCISLLRVYARKNNIITDLDEKTYNAIMIDVIDLVYYNLAARAESFGIVTDGDMMLVGDQLVHSVTMILIGTGGLNNYKKLLTETTQRNENVQVGQNPQQQQIQPQKASWMEKARQMLR